MISKNTPTFPRALRAKNPAISLSKKPRPHLIQPSTSHDHRNHPILPLTQHPAPTPQTPVYSSRRETHPHPRLGKASMERMPEPQPPPQAGFSTQRPQSGQSQTSQQTEQAGSRSWVMPTGFASTGANPHTQSFEEIYGVPENFLEIEVNIPSTIAYRGHLGWTRSV